MATTPGNANKASANDTTTLQRQTAETFARQNSDTLSSLYGPAYSCLKQRVSH